jgi:hypothetical protein
MAEPIMSPGISVDGQAGSLSLQMPTCTLFMKQEQLLHAQALQFL